MKKFVVVFIILCVVFSTALFAFNFKITNPFASNISEPTPEVEGKPKETITKTPTRTSYDIKAKYNGKNLLKSTMSLTYVNNTKDTMEELCFHLYPNMFNSRESVPFFKQDFARAFPRGFSKGEIKLNDINQKGEKLSWNLFEGNQILKVVLDKPVEPGDFTKISFDFELIIPNANFRFGYQNFGNGKITTSLANWYPILGVYNDGNWAMDKHAPLGDCTYSEIADYTVEFTTPKDYTVAASGVLKDQKTKGDEITFIYSAPKVREFAASISNNYEIAEDMIDGIRIISYFHPEDKKGGFMALNVAKYALGIFNKSFGKYPYLELRIAEANYYLGGMEFPTFIMISSARYKEPNLSNTTLERSTAHEVAHQWWYGLVGNDQINEPWVDEGITEFCTAYYFEKRYGAAGREAYFGRQVDTTKHIIKNSKRCMLDPVTKFTHQSEYFPVVYISGVLFFEDLREHIGEEELIEFFRSYLHNYKYKNVSLEEFISFLKNKKYEALDESFFEKWFGN